MERAQSHWGGYCDVNYTGNGDESLSDLDSGEVGNYGADSEVAKFLQNDEETQGCEELRSPTDVEVFKIFAKDQILPERERGKKPRNFNKFNKKLTGELKGRNGFRKMQANVGEIGEREKETFWGKSAFS